MDSKTVVLLGILFSIFGLGFALADPAGVDTVNITSNSTYTGLTTGTIANISGGYIADINLTSNSQNTRWKAFVGWVNGQFTLDDASGSTIYDWSLSTIAGEVYATRTSGSVTWGSIGCASTANLEAENGVLYHTSVDDNITATFGESPINHTAFTVAGQSISEDNCPTLNTYVDNSSQPTEFEEVVLNDGTNNVYATVLEEDLGGYDGDSYDFQMIVPENGSSTWTGATAYYLYVELN